MPGDIIDRDDSLLPLPLPPPSSTSLMYSMFLNPSFCLMMWKHLNRLGLSRLRTSRSHESLLCGPGGSSPSPQNAVQTVDLSSSESGDIGVKQLHQSVLGEEHCLQITRPSGNVYIACSNAEERDRWRNWYVVYLYDTYCFPPSTVLF